MIGAFMALVLGLNALKTRSIPLFWDLTLDGRPALIVGIVLVALGIGLGVFAIVFLPKLIQPPPPVRI
jgi:type IV secretory pathway VirB3-like protein